MIALVVVLFLAISVLLARFLSVENVERDADLALIQAQARGDVAGNAGQAQRLPAEPRVRGRRAGRRGQPAPACARAR